MAALTARAALRPSDRVELRLGLLSAVIAASLAVTWALATHGVVVILAYMPCVGLCVVLGAVDAKTHRLPNRLTLVSYPIAALALTVAAVVSARPAALATAALGGALALAWYGVLIVARPGSMGLGDLKLAGVLGLYLGWWGPIAVCAGLAAGSLLAGVVAAALWLSRRIHRTSPIAYGPWMMLGALGVIVTSAAGR